MTEEAAHAPPGQLRTLARLSWPGLLLWAHLLTWLVLERLPIDALDSPFVWPLLLYAPFAGVVIAALAVGSLLWLLYVWREDDEEAWLRLLSVAILVSPVVTLRAWLQG